MKDRYFLRESLLIVNQIAVIAYLCVMASIGNLIGDDNLIQFLLLSMLLADAAYISYRNVKGNNVLSQFSYLLLLLGWQFLLSLFENHLLSMKLSYFLLPISLYQSFYFIQVFVFQESGYRWQKHFLAVCKITCMLSVIGFFISQRAFSILYQIQMALSFLAILWLGIVHRRRICFVLKSQKRELLSSILLIGLPLMGYVMVLHRHAGHMENMGSYVFVMLTFFSVHSIVFTSRTQQEQVVTMKKEYALFITVLGMAAFLFTASLFQIPIMAVFVLAHILVLLTLIFQLLLYWQIRKLPKYFCNPMDRQHFYTYSLAQIKREETLKKEFSNYLHDDILQDLLSIKNLVGKADRPDVQQLIYDTLGELNATIRSQMQAYHPTLLKSLTLKENIQTLIDTLTEKHPAIVILDCSDTVFLVEPYNILIYRMIRELVTNALKHSGASKIRVLLTQEHGVISLKVSDDGKGFETAYCQGCNHRGLASIQEQVSLLDGAMNIESAAESGTQITITMPMRGEDSYESFIGR